MMKRSVSAPAVGAPAGSVPTAGVPSAPVAATQRVGLAELRDALDAFMAAERRLRGRYQKAGDVLSHGRLRALFVLMAQREATPGHLAREAELNSGSVTAMIDQLETQGLVQRRRDDHDRRMSWLSLTDLGQAVVADKRQRWNRRLAEAFADIPDQDLEAASRVLDRVTTVFESIENPETA